MPKRKIAEVSDGGSWLSHRLSVKFDHEVQTLARALKVARGFEKQKMGRRGKQARSGEGSSEGKDKEETLGRLGEENKILKELDMNTTATKYIYKNLTRTKRIAETPAFKEFSESRRLTVEAPRSSAEANVLARLFKSNPVKNEPPRILDGFRRLLGVDGPANKQDATKDTAQKPEKRKEKDTTVKHKPKVVEADVDVDMDEEEDIGGSESEEGDDNSHDGNDNDDIDIDSDDLAQFDSRLANSDSGSGSEDEDEDPNLDAMSITPSPQASREPSPESSPESSREPSPAPKKTKPTASSLSTKTPVTSTTFLPSLSMGGYVSASDSESDPDPENSDLNAKPQRKNRMGQQARRALWEKKYGAGAKHVQKEMQNKKRDRDSGWDVRRGATTSGGNSRDGRGTKGYGNNRRDGYDSGQRRPHGQAREKPQDDKPIHPSWEAARKAKEQKQGGAAAFQGKKVTFD